MHFTPLIAHLGLRREVEAPRQAVVARDVGKQEFVDVQAAIGFSLTKKSLGSRREGWGVEGEAGLAAAVLAIAQRGLRLETGHTALQHVAQRVATGYEGQKVRHGLLVHLQLVRLGAHLGKAASLPLHAGIALQKHLALHAADGEALHADEVGAKVDAALKRPGALQALGQGGYGAQVGQGEGKVTNVAAQPQRGPEVGPGTGGVVGGREAGLLPTRMGQPEFEIADAGLPTVGTELETEVIDTQTATLGEREGADTEVERVGRDVPQTEVGIDVSEGQMGRLQAAGLHGDVALVVDDVDSPQNEGGDAEVEGGGFVS